MSTLSNVYDLFYIFFDETNLTLVNKNEIVNENGKGAKNY